MEEPVGQELFPGRMSEGNKDDLAAEFFEHVSVLNAFAFLAKGNEVDGMVFCQAFQEVKGPLTGLPVQGVGNVRVNNEDIHDRNTGSVESGHGGGSPRIWGGRFTLTAIKDVAGS